MSILTRNPFIKIDSGTENSGNGWEVLPLIKGNLLFRGFQLWRQISEWKRALVFVQGDISQYSISIGGNCIGKFPNRFIGFSSAEKINKLKNNCDFHNYQDDSKDYKK